MTSLKQCDATLLYQLARRRNPRRALLVVSTVLAKHIPVGAPTALAAGRLLAERVAGVLAADRDPGSAAGVTPWSALADASGATAVAGAVPAAPEVSVLGFCETAVGLGACVADTLGASYLHSTRYPRPDQHVLVAFDEVHSHAPHHVIAHGDPGVLDHDRPLVLVDDELTTGRTALAAIGQLHERWPRSHYVIASLLDWRDEADIEACHRYGDLLGASIRVTSLHQGDHASLPVPDPACPLVCTPEPGEGEVEAEVVVHHRPDIPVATPFRTGDSGHHRSAATLAEALSGLGVGAVVGVEECIFLPMLVAERLAVTVQSTTLSPIIGSTEPGYPIRSVLAFRSPGGTADAFVYNLRPGVVTAVIADAGRFDLNLAMARSISARVGAPVHLVLTGAAAGPERR